MKVKEDYKTKIVSSPSYNFIFSKVDGFMMRWGETKDTDPIYSPFGPEHIDVEITDICYGPLGDGKVCAYCYKNNHTTGNYMQFDTFKHIFDTLPKTVTQIAFGVDAQCITNPDTFKIMHYCRNKGVVPNVTVANVSDETADKLANVCGAVAVSLHHDKDVCYNSIKKLTDRGMKQTNMHVVICNETLHNVYDVIEDYINGDKRLEKLNAIVLLSLKQKGRGSKYTPLTQNQFNELFEYAMKYNIPLGMDSCSCTKLMKAVENCPNKKDIETLSDPCESGIFSWYINTYGFGFPCSFTEGEGEWNKGIDLKNNIDFLNDVWYSEDVIQWRDNLLKIGRKCPVFNV